MTVVITQYGNFMRVSGTIAEVLNEIYAQKITKCAQIAYYTDDKTDAVALIGRTAY
jgi:hypothetical protein